MQGNSIKESPSQQDQEQSKNPLPDTQNQKIIQTSGDMNLRTLKSGILESAAILPKNSKISVSPSSQPVNYQYRKDDGSLAFSSTGFYPQVRIEQSSLSASEISRLNKLATGLYISATISGDLFTGASYPALTPGPAGTGFQANFAANGRPVYSYTTSNKKRFPNTLNKAISMSSLPGAAQVKWGKIMQELKKVGDRTVSTNKSLLIIDKTKAMQFAIDFEKTGKVQTSGAWSIAVDGTATRNGFANVPCAEFMSESLRQAYARAGYSHWEDFNSSNKNILTYFNGAALVANFSAYLDRAGWIPWDSQTYIPPAGAIMMHAQGLSPGHTYMSAGDNGRFIVDNGMPQGRDLRSTSQNTIEMMYRHGVFFLPPGFIPKKW